MDKPINQITSIKSLEELRSYLDQKSNLNLALITDKLNNTLLHTASIKNDLPRLKLFIKHYKEFTQLNHGTGLYTGESGFNDKLRAWANSPNLEGYVPILYAALHGNLDMVKFLEECGANMFYRTTKSENILFMAVENNKVKVLIYLLQSQNHYNISERNSSGNTILHQAAAKGHMQLVAYLLTVGADMTIENDEGETPFLVAIKENKKEIVKLLLIKGADRNDMDKNGKKGIEFARENGKEDLVKILDDEFGCLDKVKIKCNKKIVYRPEKPSYSYSVYFFCLFLLFFLPINVLSEFKTDERYVIFIPMLFESIYLIITFIVYLLLFKKFPLKRQEDLLHIDGPFCPECKRSTNDKIFHCHICKRCIHRYDHHCPWINNCVGSHNVGKFTFFLSLLIFGLVEVCFCSICLIIWNGDKFVGYRKKYKVNEEMFPIPEEIKMPLNIVTVLFSFILLLGILNIFLEQCKNLLTNSTGIERQKKKKNADKSGSLLSSSATLSESFISQNNESEQKNGCFKNCMDMLSEDY